MRKIFSYLRENAAVIYKGYLHKQSSDSVFIFNIHIQLFSVSLFLMFHQNY